MQRTPIVPPSTRPDSFEVRIARVRGVVSVVVSGDADLPHRDELDEALSRATEGSPAVVVVDLRGVSFMDGSGLKAVLSAHARSEEEGWTLILLRGAPAVDLLFEASGTEGLLHLV